MLRLRDLAVGYRGKAVLSGLSGNYEPGVHALLGPNGVGKSTLFKTVAGMKKPISGKVAVDGRVGLLPQDNLPRTRLTVEEQLSYMVWLHKLADESEAERVSSLCDLSGLLTKKISTLSGGVRRRVAIACSLVGNPDVLLLDEPSVGLDIVQRAALKKILRTVAQDTVVMYSTHIVGDLVDFAETVTIVSQGVCAFSGSMYDFVGEDQHDVTLIEKRYLQLLGDSQ